LPLEKPQAAECEVQRRHDTHLGTAPLARSGARRCHRALLRRGRWVAV